MTGTAGTPKKNLATPPVWPVAVREAGAVGYHYTQLSPSAYGLAHSTKKGE